MGSNNKKYAVTVTRHWYDRENHRPCRIVYETPDYVMARSPREAAERVRRRYLYLSGGPENVTFSCEAREIGV